MGWSPAGSLVAGAVVQGLLQRLDGVPEVLQGGVQVEGLLERPQGGPGLLQLQVALAHPGGGPEVVRVEPQHRLAVLRRPGELAPLEEPDGPLVVRFGEVRGPADQLVEGGPGGFRVTLADRPLALPVLLGRPAPEPAAPTHAGAEAGAETTAGG